MKTYSKKTIVSKLVKAGLLLDHNDSCVRGHKKLEIKYNGKKEDDFCYIAIRDLLDPDRGEVDHFTTYWPQTIKAAISEMNRGA